MTSIHMSVAQRGTYLTQGSFELRGPSLGLGYKQVRCFAISANSQVLGSRGTSREYVRLRMALIVFRIANCAFCLALPPLLKCKYRWLLRQNLKEEAYHKIAKCIETNAYGFLYIVIELWQGWLKVLLC